jgi:hypothetical protein
MQPHRYNYGIEATVIELTEEQVQELSKPHSSPPQLLNPRTNEAFVLLRVDEYRQLTTTRYDDSHGRGMTFRRWPQQLPKGPAGTRSLLTLRKTICVSR